MKTHQQGQEFVCFDENVIPLELRMFKQNPNAISFQRLSTGCFSISY